MRHKTVRFYIMGFVFTALLVVISVYFASSSWNETTASEAKHQQITSQHRSIATEQSRPLEPIIFNDLPLEVRKTLKQSIHVLECSRSWLQTIWRIIIRSEQYRDRRIAFPVSSIGGILGILFDGLGGTGDPEAFYKSQKACEYIRKIVYLSILAKVPTEICNCENQWDICYRFTHDELNAAIASSMQQTDISAEANWIVLESLQSHALADNPRHESVNACLNHINERMHKVLEKIPESPLLKK